jgi:hypothetical protein
MSNLFLYSLFIQTQLLCMSILNPCTRNLWLFNQHTVKRNMFKQEEIRPALHLALLLGLLWKTCMTIAMDTHTTTIIIITQVAEEEDLALFLERQVKVMFSVLDIELFAKLYHTIACFL